MKPPSIGGGKLSISICGGRRRRAEMTARIMMMSMIDDEWRIAEANFSRLHLEAIPLLIG